MHFIIIILKTYFILFCFACVWHLCAVEVRKGLQSPWITGGWEQPDSGAGNWTKILWKSSKYS